VKRQGLLLTVMVFFVLLVIPLINPVVDDLHAYVSPGNFYGQGALPVEIVNIPDTTAPVELDVYTPSVADTYPVVVFQHGFGGSIKAYETISNHLASHGFVVILPQMYGPGFQDAPIAEEEAVLGLQIISWVEDNINSHIPVTADTSLLGLAGHSRGGQVAYRMALQIPQKVKALAGVDPVDALGFAGQTPIITGPLNFDIPTYILGTGLGPIVVEGGPIEVACAPEEVGPIHFYCANPNPTWLVISTTHGHADMIDEENFSEFCPGGPDRDGMRTLTGGTLAAFFSGILQENGAALSVLSSPASAPVPVTVEKNRTGSVCGGEIPPSAIPTLSEWGIIMFMTILLGTGVVTLVRRRVG
jgi:pimeloyl-ACP methyl ester carboxylesterase